ncbi:hypothetical protein TNCV_295311 [Trichonephila clavipes]|nr:hypothetical protein TNCV_295311 [Trichonephila clavipes]
METTGFEAIKICPSSCTQRGRFDVVPSAIELKSPELFSGMSSTLKSVSKRRLSGHAHDCAGTLSWTLLPSAEKVLPFYSRKFQLEFFQDNANPLMRHISIDQHDRHISLISSIDPGSR